ncbi:hypothetical protein D3C72_896060 [compost metagenome]
MAGATSKGARTARAEVPSRSSARPWANLAIVLAVAGQISMASTPRVRSMCSMPPVSGSAHWSTCTGWRLIDWKVRGVTKRVAASVITTRTSQPCLRRRDARSTDL